MSAAVQVQGLLEVYDSQGAGAVEALEAPQLTWEQVRPSLKVISLHHDYIRCKRAISTTSLFTFVFHSQGIYFQSGAILHMHALIVQCIPFTFIDALNFFCVLAPAVK